MSRQSPAEIIDSLYDLSNRMQAAYEALAAIPCGRRPQFDALADRPIFWGDLDVAAREINAIADAWGDEIATGDIGERVSG